MFVIKLSFITLFCLSKLLYLVLLGRPLCLCIASFHLETNVYFFSLASNYDRYSGLEK